MTLRQLIHILYMSVRNGLPKGAAKVGIGATTY